VLRVSTMTVYRLVRSGELPAIRVGKSFRIQQHDLTAYLAEGVVRADHSNG
jgi:excisionase family DNA binding protein